MIVIKGKYSSAVHFDDGFIQFEYCEVSESMHCAVFFSQGKMICGFSGCKAKEFKEKWDDL